MARTCCAGATMSTTSRAATAARSAVACNPGLRATPGRNAALVRLRDDLGNNLGLARPDQCVAAGATHGLREGCAPSATAHNPDAAERHLQRSP